MRLKVRDLHLIWVIILKFWCGAIWWITICSSCSFVNHTWTHFCIWLISHTDCFGHKDKLCAMSCPLWDYVCTSLLSCWALYLPMLPVGSKHVVRNVCSYKGCQHTAWRWGRVGVGMAGQKYSREQGVTVTSRYQMDCCQVRKDKSARVSARHWVTPGNLVA